MDKSTGKENPTYQVKVGDVKKIRIYNEPNSAHPMQHPIHLHGVRFLILNIDGKSNDNLGWKDVVLVPAGSMMDILVEFTQSGEWMEHCHIAEHLEAGMSFLFSVAQSDQDIAATSLPPLKQFKSGIAAKEVYCEGNLQLVTKKLDGSLHV